MNKMIFLLLFFSVSIGISHAEKEISPINEIIEWSLIGTFCVGNYHLSRSDVWTQHPLIGGPTGREYKNGTVSSSWITYSGITMGAGMIFIPNDEGWLNRVSYENTKGLIEAMVLTSFITSIAKNAVGRKRPSYDSYPDAPDARKSFFSGHTSSSFCLAAYGSLYIADHIGDGRRPIVFAGKTAAVAALFSLAAYVGYTRVNDNKHHVLDVVAGALAGSGISFLVYRFHNSEQMKKGDSAVNMNQWGDMTSLSVSLAL